MEIERLRELVKRCAILLEREGICDGHLTTATFGVFGVCQFVGETWIILRRGASTLVLTGPAVHIDRRPQVEFMLERPELAHQALEAMRRYMVLDDLARL